jgi:hypothetical protein
MSQTAIFGPFLSMILLSFAVWIYMYSRRIPFVTRSRLTPEQLTPAELARLSPPHVANPSDNLKNLFEVPTLFYALALYLYVTAQVDAFYVTAAWTFVAFRILHSAVHCTVNIVILRFWLYAAATVALGAMFVRVGIVYLAT